MNFIPWSGSQHDLVQLRMSKKISTKTLGRSSSWVERSGSSSASSSLGLAYKSKSGGCFPDSTSLKVKLVELGLAQSLLPSFLRKKPPP